MRNLKKVLALVIAFSMMLSVVAFAGYADVDADADYASAVELTSALGIFQGDENGNFNADKTITRAEMAAVIIRMQGLDAAAKASAGATEFADVAADHWASGYINLASQNGIIKGTGDGNFAPNDTLTYEAAVAMIVRALGFEPVAERKGGWTAGYVAVANSYKVTEGAAATATRGNLAILVANAMDTPMMDQTSYGSDEKYEVLDGKNDRDYRTLLTDMDVSVINGVVGAKDGTSVTIAVAEDSKDGNFKIQANGKAKDYDFEIGESNVLAYQDQQVDAYVLKDGRTYTVLAVIPSNVGETFEILSDDLVAHANGKLEYYVDAANSNKTKEIKVAADVPVEFNKGADTKTLADFIGENGLKDVELVFIENTGDSTFDKVIATQYVSDVVSYVDAARDRLSLKNASTITFDFENEDATIILVDDKDNEIALEDLAEGDVVAIVADNTKPARYEEYIKVIKLANAAVEGTVDETYTSNGVEYIVIDGQEYPKAIGDDLEAGTEGIFYIGLTGKVIYFDGSLVGENYAYILEGAIANGAFTNDQWQLKLLTKDGVETFDIRKNSHDDIAAYIVANFLENKDAQKFIFDTADKNADTFNGKLNQARLVTYKVDGNGDIKELAPVAGYKLDDKGEETTELNVLETFNKLTDEYNADAQRIAKQLIEDDVVIFNVSGKDAKDAQVTDISYLVDEASYTGFVGTNDDAENVVMVITDLESVYTEDTGFAVVTKISTGRNDEGEEVTKISYVQNEEEGVITLDDDTDCENATDVELAIGDAFMFVADGEGLVSKYKVIATLDGNAKNNKVFKLTAEAEDAENNFGENTEIVKGYILNEKYESTSKGEVITVGADTYVIRGTAYKYTYNAVGRNTTIEVADFMADADYKAQDVKDSDTWYASPVLLRIVDGIVVDVYGTTARIAQIKQ